MGFMFNIYFLFDIKYMPLYVMPILCEVLYVPHRFRIAETDVQFQDRQHGICDPEALPLGQVYF
jgi:hypothetical protein